MRSRTPPDLAGRCHACFFPEALCLCAAARPVPTAVEVVIVRHAMERWKTSNTARWTLLALKHSRLIEHGLPSGDADLPSFPPGTWLVFPAPTLELPDGLPPARLVFVDGSWSQARRMAQRLDALRSLPRLALPPPAPGVARLRRPGSVEQMSTIEAVSAALRRVGEADAASHLASLQALAVERSAALRGAAHGT